MKAYQKTQLYKFLSFLDVQKDERLLVCTIPKDASIAEGSRERDFLAEARAFFSLKEEIETCAIDEVASLWDDRLYDVILLRYVLFHRRGFPMDEKKTMGSLARHLAPGGRIVAVEQNRLGLNVLAGDRYDDRAKDKGLLKSELLSAFSYAGLDARIYYPHPLSETMEYIFTDKMGPTDEPLYPAVWEGDPRAGLFDEGNVAAMAAKEGAFFALSNQFICVAGRGEPSEKKNGISLIYRRYLDTRREDFRIAKSLYEIAGSDANTTRVWVLEPVGEASSVHVKGMMENYLRLDSVYKGYTLQIASCSYEKNRLILGRTEGRSLAECLDEALEREFVEECIRFVGQLSDILSTPSRIDVLAGKKREFEFSANEDFNRIFGPLNRNEEEVLSGEFSLPLSPVALSFSEIFIKGRAWILSCYEWLCDFPVPFSYCLYVGLFEYCASEKVVEYENAKRRTEGAASGESFYEKALKSLGISKEMEIIFSRMRGNFISYIEGNMKSRDAILKKCISDGDFLPISECMSAFVDSGGKLPIKDDGAINAAPKGFFEKVFEKLRRWRIFYRKGSSQ